MPFYERKHIDATTCSFQNYVKYTMILLLKVCKVNGFMRKNYEIFIKESQSSSITWISR